MASLAFASQADAVQSPINLTPPVLSGTSVVGSTVSATDGTWDADPAVSDYTYEWQRRNPNTGLWSAIAGAADQSTYTLAVADYDTFVRVLVTASNGITPDGQSLSNTTQRIQGIQPFNTGNTGVDGTVLPTLDDNEPTVQDGVGVNVGTWGGVPTQVGEPLDPLAPMTYAYQWYTCPSSSSVPPTGCTAVGTDSVSYTPVTADIGKYLAARVTADNNAAAPVTDTGTAYTLLSTSPIAGIPPSNTTPPSISGITTVYETLTTSDGLWDGDPPQAPAPGNDMDFT